MAGEEGAGRQPAGPADRNGTSDSRGWGAGRCGRRRACDALAVGPFAYPTSMMAVCPVQARWERAGCCTKGAQPLLPWLS